MLARGCRKPSRPVCVTVALNREPGDLCQVSMWEKHKEGHWRCGGQSLAPKGPQQRRAKVKSGMRHPDMLRYPDGHSHQNAGKDDLETEVTSASAERRRVPQSTRSAGHGVAADEAPEKPAGHGEEDVDLGSTQSGLGRELRATDKLPGGERPGELLSLRPCP